MKKILTLTILTWLLCYQLYAQQQFTQTVTALNTNCNNHCTIIDAPGLNNNPAALIFATPVMVNGVNPYPLAGALYRTYEQKWSIFNPGGAVMTVGAKFNLEYYTAPDANHFVYIVPQRVHSYDDANIDHAGLNNNPDAQIRVFPTNPTTGNVFFNQYEVRVAYVASDSKWIIANNNNGGMPAGVSYNVMFSGGATNTNSGKTINPNPKTPGLIVPNEKAGGDLNGNYPDPTVIGLQGKPISSNMPTVGQTLGWNGTEWIPFTADPIPTVQTPTSLPPNGNAGGDLGGTYPSPTVQKLGGRTLSNATPTVGQVLKWNGTAWEPAADNVGSASQTAQGSKPSVLYFNSSNPPIGMLEMRDPNVNTAKIGGLDNQVFTLTQSSRIVFHTTVAAQNGNLNFFKDKVSVWLNVDILNSSGAMVGRATAGAVLETGFPVQTIVAVGIGILPAGTYHTRVTLNRGANASALSIFDSNYDGLGAQGSQMILEIFPD